eukprot:4760189-Ditylum_brightwellii.AAC.1
MAEDLEKLDEEISRIMEDAENKISDYPKFWWSDALHNVYQVLEYWKAAMSFKNNNIYEKLMLTQQHNKIDQTMDVYQGNENRKASAQLRKARKHLTKCRNKSYDLRQEYLTRK